MNPFFDQKFLRVARRLSARCCFVVNTIDQEFSGATFPFATAACISPSNSLPTPSLSSQAGFFIHPVTKSSDHSNSLRWIPYDDVTPACSLRLQWVDSDAFFTDMAFEVPLDKYKEHNLVFSGNRKDVSHVYFCRLLLSSASAQVAGSQRRLSAKRSC